MKDKQITKETIDNTVKFAWLTLAAIITIMILCFSSLVCVQAEDEVISTRTDLLRAIREAADGDVILVGDVDFGLTGGGAIHESERLIIDKSLTIRGASSE